MTTAKFGISIFDSNIKISLHKKETSEQKRTKPHKVQANFSKKAPISFKSSNPQ